MASSSMLQGLPEETLLNLCSQFAVDGVGVSDGFHSLTALYRILAYRENLSSPQDISIK
ncbi:hypothetical protein GJ744_010075 [Endocarpon pusillum]|uniref:Uncharacterized protein n=1 Tax=Endocarpon pusillum TaxID=364733 RepID=A0A8H7E249_9EURO|nr:hypothetical protein GJ744_010075 [Endocarpon pusillum]